MILSPISKVDEEIVVCVPLTSKSPVNTKLANVTLSFVCKPKSTSVFTPLVANLTVPWEGELNTDAETIPCPDFNA